MGEKEDWRGIVKIVILRTNTGDFGKVGTYNVQEVGLANALVRLGHKVDVLYLHRDTDVVVRDEHYSFVYYLPHKTFLMHGIFDTKLLSGFSPEKLILFSDNQLWAKNVILWCKKNSVKCIHYFGNVLSDNPNWKNQVYTKLILFRNKNSYKYSINVAKTDAVKNEMIKNGIPFKKIINVGLDRDVLSEKRNVDWEIRRSLEFLDNEIILLFVGRLVDYKKPILACSILEKLLSYGINARLVIIGKGTLEQKLEQYIIIHELKDRIIWKKEVPYKEIYKYMVSCDVVINLSTKEIFGMTILEAMYYGVPVVANKAPGPNVIIEDEVSGYLCDFDDDLNKWANQIMKALENRNSISIAAHSRITDNFMWDNIAVKFLEL